MKIPAAAAIITIALSLFYQPLYAASPPPRHVDPNEIRGDLPDPLMLARIYATIANHIAGGNLSEALKELSRAGSIYLPRDLAIILEQYNKLLSQGIDRVNFSKASLEEARKLLSRGMVVDAIKVLERGLIEVLAANISSREAYRSAEDIKRRLGADVGEASRALERVVGATYSEISAEIKRLEYLGSVSLESTILTISINVSRAWVGSPIEIVGSLTTSSGDPLEGRRVRIFIGGVEISVNTGDGGSYRLEAILPTIYIPRISVYAVYTPSRGDELRYRGAVSEELYVDLLYIVPSISLSITPDRVKPGESFVVVGVVDPPGGGVAITFLGRSYMVDLSPTGSFTAKVEVPSDIGEGVYAVSVDVYPRGFIGPASASAKIYVYRDPSFVEAKIPRIVIAGLSYEVLGRAATEEGQPLDGGVRIELPWTSISTASYEGVFRARLSIPIGETTGEKVVRIMFMPSSKMYREAEIEERIFVINPAYVAAFLGVAYVAMRISLGSIAMTLRNIAALFQRRGGGSSIGESVEIQAPVGETISERLIASDEVVLVFHGLVEAVRRITGVELLTHMTLREYGLAASKALGGAGQSLLKILKIYEAHLYSPRKTSPAEFKALAEEFLKSLAR